MIFGKKCIICKNKFEKTFIGASSCTNDSHKNVRVEIGPKSDDLNQLFIFFNIYWIQYVEYYSDKQKKLAVNIRKFDKSSWKILWSEIDSKDFPIISSEEQIQNLLILK